eukprot:gene22857-27626_t
MRERLRKQELDEELAAIFRGAQAEIAKAAREQEAARVRDERSDIQADSEWQRIFTAAEKEITRLEKAALAAEKAAEQAAEKTRKVSEAKNKKRAVNGQDRRKLLLCNNGSNRAWGQSGH